MVDAMKYFMGDIQSNIIEWEYSVIPMIEFSAHRIKQIIGSTDIHFLLSTTLNLYCLSLDVGITNIKLMIHIWRKVSAQYPGFKYYGKTKVFRIGGTRGSDDRNAMEQQLNHIPMGVKVMLPCWYSNINGLPFNAWIEKVLAMHHIVIFEKNKIPWIQEIMLEILDPNPKGGTGFIHGLIGARFGWRTRGTMEDVLMPLCFKTFFQQNKI